ncbi:MFS transporter [Natrinema halophilum]|uniref:MFS transporter n=1 Tax=Natrinema halophilum TaxID=1699371 RepID=A0A7D5K8P6_9EURY|nr:MFS transporter [Natrinema halophilum]QLG50903.1 MFS transporter [Natrinema halophilum]
MPFRRVRDAVASVPRQTALVVGLISGSQFANHAFLVLLPPILPLLSSDLDVSIAILGVALGAQALVNTAFQLPFGYLGDHYDRTIALGLSSVLGAVGAIVTALATSFPVLLVGQIVLGIGVAGHHPAHYPLLSDATTEDTRGRAFAVYNFGGSLGFATPPVFITAIISIPGLTWRHAIATLGLIGLAYAILITAVFARCVDDEISAPNVEPSATDDPLPVRIRSELRALVSEPGILALAVLALFASTANWGVTSYAVVFLTDVYGLSLGLANLTLTGLFVVGAGAILLGGYLTDRFGGGRVLVVSFLGFTALVGLIAARLVPVTVAIGLFLVLGAVRSMAGPARDELTERLADRGTVAKSFAIVTIGMMLGSSIAPPAFGYIIQWVGVKAAFFAVAGVALAASVVTLFVVAEFADAPGGTSVAGD